MKDLDLLNPAFAKPKNLCSVGAAIPFIFSLSSIALTSGASKNTSTLENPLSIFFILTSIISFALIFLPRVFDWGWSARNFFISSIEMGCIGMLGSVPWLCFLLYSSIFWPYRLFFFISYITLIILSVRKLRIAYGEVKKTPNLLNYIYQSAEGETYYLQKNDNFILEKKYKLSLFPSTAYFIIFLILSLTTLPFAKDISEFIGLPYPHVFLGIFSIPIDMMALMFLTRGWFVFYYIPKHIKKDNSIVYVDMASKTKWK